MISIQNLSFRYERSRPAVLEQLNLEMTPGTTLLKGYSGSGKSTLLRLLGGFLRPTSGQIETPWGPPTERRFQREHLGFLFQKLNLLPRTSLRRNIRIAAEFSSIAQAQIEANLAFWSQHLGIADLLDHTPETLSVGQQQRAALVRVFTKEPSVLLLDEPTSGLDDTNTQKIVEAIRTYLRPGRYCIIATHDARLEALDGQTVLF